MWVLSFSLELEIVAAGALSASPSPTHAGGGSSSQNGGKPSLKTSGGGVFGRESIPSSAKTVVRYTAKIGSCNDSALPVEKAKEIYDGKRMQFRQFFKGLDCGAGAQKRSGTTVNNRGKDGKGTNSAVLEKAMSGNLGALDSLAAGAPNGKAVPPTQRREGRGSDVNLDLGDALGS